MYQDAFRWKESQVHNFRVQMSKLHVKHCQAVEVQNAEALCSGSAVYLLQHNLVPRKPDWGNKRMRKGQTHRHTENLGLGGSHSLWRDGTQLWDNQEPQHVYCTQHEERLVLCGEHSQAAVLSSRRRKLQLLVSANICTWPVPMSLRHPCQ